MAAKGSIIRGLIERHAFAVLRRLTFNTVGSLNVVLTTNPGVTQSGQWTMFQNNTVGTTQQIQAETIGDFQQGVRARFARR